MKFFSFLGSEGFFTLFVPLIYWSVDEALGLRLGYILLTGSTVNELFKLLLHGPRPYWVSSDVKPLAAESSFGVPSGHSQVSAGFWGVVAVYTGRAWVFVGAILLVTLIGLSRLYLGVHFPHDVFFGWLLGFQTLWLFTRLWNPVARRLKALPLGKQIGLACAVPMGMLLLSVLLRFRLSGFALPEAWGENAVRGGGPAPHPLSLHGVLIASATLFGLSLGLILTTARGGFSARGSLGQRGLRFLVGLVGVIALNLVKRAIPPRGEMLLPCLFVQYALIGLWVTGGAVFVFTKLHLTEKSDSQAA